MTDSCNTCGTTATSSSSSSSSCSLMNCKRCKSVAYCSAECQRQDWKTHRTQCKRQDMGRAPCDGCLCMEKDIVTCCFACGFLQCMDCDNKQKDRLLDHGPIDGLLKPCPHCRVLMEFPIPMRAVRKFERLIDAKPNDPRQVHWLDALGGLYLTCHDSPTIGDDNKKKAKKAFLRAGKLGLGQGYCAVAEMYLKEKNWGQAWRYYNKAAKLYNVKAIHALGMDAVEGGFLLGNSGIVEQQDQQRLHEPDLETAFRWFQEGARLDDPHCCASLARCYQKGEGTEKDFAKGFKLSRRAAKGGSAQGMHQCGYSYLHGKGVKQSLHRATIYFERSLEVEDNEDVRAVLYQLQHDADFVNAIWAPIPDVITVITSR